MMKNPNAQSPTSTQVMTNRTKEAVAEAERWTARNYNPLPVVITKAEGVWVTDLDGRRYIDCVTSSAVLNFGHHHPVIIEAARKQLDNLTLIGRGLMQDQFGPFCRELAELCNMDMCVIMNSGVEAIETAIKVARKWGYRVKKVEANQANIIVAADNFHGRTTTAISLSTDPLAREDYGPYTPGFRVVPYNDLDEMREAIDKNTVAVLIEPIQGEAGIVVPDDGYLEGVRELCTKNNVLFIADEIQTGLGRTGYTFACDYEGVVPDMYVIGKGLGGGILPVSAVVSRADVLGVLTPGTHGSTFGGNPLACAIGWTVVKLMKTGEYQQRSRDLGKMFHEGLAKLVGRGVTAVRGRGLWAGVDIDPKLMTGRQVSERLKAAGILARDCHDVTVRLAPPLIITEDEIRQIISGLKRALT